MKLLQTYYTSCPKGQLGGSGFQFYAHSNGLNSEELKELGVLGNYTPPLNLPTQPTKKEIEDLFPIAFSYFRLSSGKVGVCKSVYLGKDYSGRFGNFFAHCLVLDSGEFPTHPVNFYNSTIFRTHLNEEELAISDTPEPLPAIILDKITSEKALDFVDIGDFLVEMKEEIFRLMLNGLLSVEETKRKIIFADSHSNSIFWITALTKSFPIILAKSITFSTYSFDPANSNLFLNHTLKEGTRFDFQNSRARDFQYYIFDIENQNFSQVEKQYQFSDFAPLAFSISEEKLLDFHTFLSQFNYTTPSKEVDVALDLSKLFSGDTLYKNLSFDQLAKYVHFITKYNKGTVGEQLLEFIRQKDNNYYLIDILPDYDSITSFINFFFNTVNKIDNIKLQTFACEFYSDIIISYLDNDGKGMQEEKIVSFLAFNDKILNLPFAKHKTFITFLFSQKRMNLIDEVLEGGDKNEQQANRHFMSAILYANYLKHYHQFEVVKEAKEFLVKKLILLSKEAAYIYEILKEIANNINFFIKLLVQVKHSFVQAHIDESNLFDAFLVLFSEKSGQWQRHIKQDLLDRQEIELLLKLTLKQLDTATSKQAFFLDNLKTYKTLFEKEPDRFKLLFLSYLKTLDAEKNPEEVIEFLDLATPIKGPSFNRTIIEELENQLNEIEPEKLSLDLAKQLLQRKQDLEIETVSNRLIVVYYARFLKNSQMPISDTIERLTNQGKIVADDAKQLFNWIIKQMVSRIQEKKHYYEIINYVVEQGELAESSRTFYRHLLDRSEKKSIRLVCNGIGLIISQDKDENGLILLQKNKLITVTKEILPDLLLNRKLKFVEKLHEHLIEQLEDDKKARKIWSAIYFEHKTLRESSKGSSMFNSFKGLFSKDK